MRKIRTSLWGTGLHAGAVLATCLTLILPSLPVAMAQPVALNASSIRTLSIATGHTSDNRTSIELATSGDSLALAGVGSDVRAEFTGYVAYTQLLASHSASPTTAVVADIDGDGVDDLVVGYSSLDGGILAVFRGNVDALYPNSPQAQERSARGEFNSEPFLPSVAVSYVPVAPQFIAAGDFDADGRVDVAVASRNSSTFYVLSTDDQQELGNPVEHRLAGSATALVAGDFERQDGRTDLVFGVATESGPAIEIFSDPFGSLNARGETLAMPGDVHAIAIGQFDDGFAIDLAVAAGSAVVRVSGRDRRYVDGTPYFAQPATSQRDVSADILDLSVGAPRRGINSLGLVASNGDVLRLSATTVEQTRDFASWTAQSISLPGSTRILGSAATGRAGSDDFVVLNATGRSVGVLSSGAPSTVAAAKSSEPELAARFDAQSDPVAVVAMRFNGDAIPDLVVLQSDRPTPTTIQSERRATFLVTNINDSGVGSLRQAIVDANASPGADTISFAITSPGRSIAVQSPLPALTDPVTIDATTQAGFVGVPIVELNGLGAGLNANGFVVQGGNTTIRGFAINRFNGNGVFIDTLGNNVVEGNYIGLDLNGLVDLGNNQDGVLVRGVAGNRVGGTTTAARNVISGNTSDGVQIDTAGATTNLVQGCFLGTNASGTSAVPNSGSGVNIVGGAVNNTVGGSVGSALNVLSGNIGDGATIEGGASAGNLVQNNRIGTTAAGTGALGNGSDGVQLSGSKNTVSTNRIAFNVADGVFCGPAGTDNQITANSISANSGLGIDLSPNGVTQNDAGDNDTGPNNLQNFPVIANAVSNGQTTTVTGSINSNANTPLVLEFFSNTAPDPTNFGEGETFLGAINVTTDAGGNANFTAQLQVSVAQGVFISATATNLNTGTSEFSAVFLNATNADVSITKIDSPDPIASGQQLTYTITVLNSGPLPAANVKLFDSTPSGTAFVSATTTQGTLMTPTSGGIGSIIATIGTVAVGSTVTIVIRLDVVGPADLTILNTAFVTSSTPDDDLSNNVVTVSTLVIEPPDITSVEKANTSGQPFKLRVNGTNFLPGVQVFIGNDTQPWPDVKYKSTSQLIIRKGSTLRSRFPKGVPVTIRVRNLNGGEDSFTYVR